MGNCALIHLIKLNNKPHCFDEKNAQKIMKTIFAALTLSSECEEIIDLGKKSHTRRDR